MDDTPRTWYGNTTLHAVLIGGSLMFALPYIWLAGTSFKLDKEIQSDDIRIFPQRPIPREKSPYIDERHFSAIEKPEAAPSGAWFDWMGDAMRLRIDAVVDAWMADHGDTVAEVDADATREALARGLFARIEHLLPVNIWTADRQSFEKALAATIKPEFVTEAFEQAYRYFALGKVVVKDTRYHVTDLDEGVLPEDLWIVESGDAREEQRQESGRTVSVLHYDFSKSDSFEVSTVRELPCPFGVECEPNAPCDIDPRFKRVAISFRRDQTWHEMQLFIEVEGLLLRGKLPRYLSEDTWWDVAYQEPSKDDLRASRQYILLERVEKNPRYDHGPRKMKLRVLVEKSSTPEAYWAKSTENYRKAFDEVPFWRYFNNSVFLVIANVIGTALSCSLAAFAFARLRWPGRDFCFLLVLATLMIPPQVTMIPSFVIYKHLGWYNTLAPLWVPNCLAVNAFAVFLLRQAMKGIPRDLEEAAQIDGCGWLRIYWTVALPLMRPTIAAISIFTFMFVWNDFMTPLIYVNDQRLYPLALGLFSFLAGRENQFTLIMAGSMIMTIPVVLIFFVAQRHFIQGITMTGMKN